MTLLLELLALIELDGSAEEIQGLYKRRKEIKDQIDDLKKRGAFVGQGIVAPQYKGQYDRLQRQLDVVAKEIERSYAAQKISKDHREAEKEYTKARLAITVDDKKAKFAKNVKDGQEKWEVLRKQYGGEKGLIDAIKAKVTKLTLDGTELLVMSKLAKAFGVPERTMYKMFERPDLHALRKHLPVAGK